MRADLGCRRRCGGGGDDAVVGTNMPWCGYGRDGFEEGLEKWIGCERVLYECFLFSNRNVDFPMVQS